MSESTDDAISVAWRMLTPEEALTGNCVCGFLVQCHITFAGDLKFYDNDGGDLVPHECPVAKGQLAAIANLWATQLTPEEARQIIDALTTSAYFAPFNPLLAKLRRIAGELKE